jgi:methyltransferase
MPDPLPVACLALLGTQRIAELLYARRTAKALVAHGAQLVARDGYGSLVAVHALFFAACLVESQAAPWAGRGWWSWIGLALFLCGQTLRYSSMAALGWRWNTRVYVLPQAPLVARGPYRLLRHPIYVGVALELVGFPVLFGLWGTALLIAVLDAAALARRVRFEEEALGMRRSRFA